MLDNGGDDDDVPVVQIDNLALPVFCRSTYFHTIGKTENTNCFSVVIQ